jgi:hypothetical protein
MWLWCRAPGYFFQWPHQVQRHLLVPQASVGVWGVCGGLLNPWWGWGQGPLEPGLTRSSSTGCTFLSASTRRRGLGEGGKEGGRGAGKHSVGGGSLAFSGQIPQGATAWRGLQTKKPGKGARRADVQRWPLPSLPQAKTLKLYLGHISRRRRGTTWRVTLIPHPHPCPNPKDSLRGFLPRPFKC